MAKVALITGVTGQDGSYLAELLLNKGYEVHGIVRRSSTFTTGRIDHLHKEFGANESPLRLHYGDLGDATGLRRIIEQTLPDEVYNLAAPSFGNDSDWLSCSTHGFPCQFPRTR